MKNVALRLVFLLILLTSTLAVIQVRAPVPGDVNGDNKVNIMDLCFIARAFGTLPSTGGTPGEWGAWNVNADLNNDQRIDIRDAYICAINYGTGVDYINTQSNGQTQVRLSPPGQQASIAISERLCRLLSSASR